MEFVARSVASLVGVVTVAGIALAAAAGPPATYEAKALQVKDLVGTLVVEVVEGGPLTVALEGREAMLEDIAVGVQGGTLVIARKKSLFDWPPREVFKWRDTYPTVLVRVPAKTPLELDGVIGRATVGDLDAPLRLDATLLNAEIGRVSEARIDLSGSGDIALGPVADGLVAHMAGSGDLVVEAARRAEITKTGSGDVRLGRLEAGFSYESTGSGNAEVESVAGPVEVRINGSGNVHLRGGRAEPLLVKIGGSGDFVFDGEARDPDLAINGSGTIRLGSHGGTVRLRAFTGTLRLGDGGSLRLAE